jgi:squalene-hopene/tetraprenyl-beta-curcumene cyclase
MPQEVLSTRDLILDTAQELIQREGVNALTIDRVAAEAGMSKGGFLYHFGSKEQLIEAFVGRFLARLEDDAAGGGRARALVRGILSEKEGGGRSGEMFASLLAALANKPELLDPLRRQYAAWLQAIENEGGDSGRAVIAWLAAEGLVFCEQFGLISLPASKRQSIAEEILALTENTTMREETVFVHPAMPPAPVQAALSVQPELRQLTRKARDAARAAAEALAELQDPAGYWRGDLTADTTLESDYVLLNLWLYPPDEAGWNPATKARIAKAARTIADRQLPDGGWNIYFAGPSELNATARAYTALKLSGFDPEHPTLRRARERVLALGGLQAANSYTKINLSLFGLFPRRYAPSVPPELTVMPGNLIYEMSSWTRAIIVPLSIVQASGAQRPAPAGFTVDELYVARQKLLLPKKDRISAVFNQADRAIKLWERRGVKDIRAKAIREAEKWMIERTRFSDGLGAIYPSMMYSIMAMDALGYERDHPDLVEALRQFDALILESGDRLQFQPAVSPIWDTAIAAFALGEAGALDPEAGRRAAEWVLDREIRRKGDWAVKRPSLQPGGWAFEFANEYYPDIDDTAMVLLALRHAKEADAERQQRAERRAIQWLLGMQSSDGGWAAFDVDNNWQLLNKVPFADHNAMLDPTCPDITGRVMEALCVRASMTYREPEIARGVRYLLGHQKEDGSWYGRWGVNYIYGTFLALRGLRASGSPATQGAVEKATAWLRSIQNEDGGWGESCASYEKHEYVTEASTPSQTAWALLGLEAAGDIGSSAARRGVEWLLENQNAAGSWDEQLATGTGFPNVFYLNYHLYSHYFPLLALARWHARANSGVVRGN